ncbi:DUF6114 domain-containing protein [Lipingzhangella sp. LS1_29]|uniref:DUF6114 domain-containing protein n=1 Tax=Lipingzhangella rawalii TaxID=2055835 RepID=A0ABU2HDD0_9ACTN|nr:DUF6114 domain-containing protein [Lipingzhangella rawalii]MDS1272569.1 DUF6114 domain-containing protein [Lipingzhangella rawalii]
MGSQLMSWLGAGRLQFRAWRRSRPFWGGLLLILAGVEILVVPTAQRLILPVDLIIYAGIAGVSGYLIGGLLIVVGALAWLQPAQHAFFGIAGTLLALTSFVTSNFGGFVIGMLLGIVGGALVFAWSESIPVRDATEPGTPRWHRLRERFARRRDTPATRSETDTTSATESDTEGSSASGPESPEDPAGDTASDRVDYRVAIALPLALVLLAVPVDRSNWWDWLIPSDSTESDEPVAESESPAESPSPTSSPSGGIGGTDDEDGSGTGGGPSPGDGDTEDETEPDDDDGDDSDDEDAEDDEDSDDDADAEECVLAVGEDAVAEDEEELAEAVAACQAAEEEGELPEVPTRSEEACFPPTASPTGMTADRLTMYGPRFEGVVECTTSDGPQRYLQLSMNRANFTRADLWFEDRGSRSTMALPDMRMRDDVVLFATRMRVRILGIPITFTPDFPPPLLLPITPVTDVEVDQPLAESANLHIDSLGQDFRDQN